MAEISNYDTSVHERFARDQQEIEAFQRQYQVLPEQARGVAVQTQVVNAVPNYPEWAQLLQVYQRKRWAYFVMPLHYTSQRVLSPYIAPSFGPVERQNAEIGKIEAFVKKKTEGKKVRRKEERAKDDSQKNSEEALLDEGDALIEMIRRGIKEPNEMVTYILSRMLQFVQA